MEISSKIKEEQNEKIQVYAPIKFTTDYSESKKYLNLFSKRLSIKYPSDILYSIYNSNDLSVVKEKELNYNKRESDLFLIYKGIEQAKAKTKRSNDVKTALENFLRKSDLIIKITKFFEEKQKLINKEKTRQNKKNKNDIEEGGDEKFIEIYINSLVSKLADNVEIQVYKKNNFVIKMNETGDNCYFLVSGILSVLKPVEYHFELSYDEYLQYLTNLIKNKEFVIIDNLRRINQYYIDIGLVEDLKIFIKSYFIIKLKKDISELFKTGKFQSDFIQKRLKLFNLSFEDYNLNSEKVNQHINEILKGSTLKEKDLIEYLEKIIILKPEELVTLKSNLHIFENIKHKFTIFKYEDFLYLKPGCFFGESALDNVVQKRNATIRTEEDCVILSLKNNIYKTVLFENNRKLKSFDVVFICKNFFFNDISTIIFNKNYFPFFKLLSLTKDDIIYRQSDQVTSVYFVKEGNIKLEITASYIELFNLINYYYNQLANNPYIKISKTELKEIRDNYLEDKTLTDLRHLNALLKEKLNKKIKFELFTSSYCDTLGLEEFFMKSEYSCTCTVISQEAKIFELSSESLNTIITTEKKCHYAYYNLISSKLVASIKRLHIIKMNYINQLNYKIKENFFGTEVSETRLIKGQTGTKRPFCRYIKTKYEPITLNSFYKNSKNEEIKNQNFLSLKKATIALNITRNINSPNNDLNIKEAETLDLSLNEDSKSKSKKKKKKKKNLKLHLDKYNVINLLFSEKQRKDSLLSILGKEKTKEKEMKSENNIGKSIMDTTMIRIGNNSLSLKEIGNRLKTSESQKNQDLSIVKNFLNKTSSFTSTKSFSYRDKLINKTSFLSLKKHKNFFNQNDIKNTENKLPWINLTKFNNKFNKTNINIRTNKSYKKRTKTKEKKIILKPLIISYKKYSINKKIKPSTDENINRINAILAKLNNLDFK
jgi:CRP-like cAMP-binding protein